MADSGRTPQRATWLCLTEGLQLNHHSTPPSRQRAERLQRGGSCFGLRRGLAALSCAAAFLAGQLFVSAAGAATTVDVDVPSDSILPGNVAVVTVVISAEELIDGHIELLLGGQGPGGTTPYKVDVEVAAGARKSVKIPVVAGFTAPSRVRVSVFDGGDSVATASKDLNGGGPPPVVTVLRPASDGAPLPATVASDFDMSAAVVREVDSERSLTLGQIAPGGVVVADASTIAELDDASVGWLGAWLRQGGDLRIAGNRPDLSNLGLDWEPDASGVMLEGSGRVTFVESIASALSRPFRPGSVARGANAAVNPQALTQDLALTAGFSAVEVRFIGGFLFGYVLIVGPALFTVTALLRRRRWVWVAVPVTAVLAIFAAVQLANQERKEQGISHSTVLNLDDSQRQIFTALGISAPTGNVSFKLPPGFAAGGSGLDSNRVEVDIHGDGATVKTLGGAGSFSVASAQGPSLVQGDVIVDAVRDGSSVAAKVTNEMPWTLYDAALQVGDSMTPLGAIEPGETVDAELDLSQPADLLSSALSVWPNVQNLVLGGDGAESGVTGVTGGLMIQLLSQPQSADRSDVRASFIGFTNEFEDPFGDGRELVGHTLVAKTAAIAPGENTSSSDAAAVPSQITVIEAARGNGATNTVRAHFDNVEEARQQAALGRIRIEGSSITARKYWDGVNWVTMDPEPAVGVPEGAGIGDDVNGDGFPDDIDGDGIVDDVDGDGIIDVNGDGNPDFPTGVPMDQFGINVASRSLVPPEAIDDFGDVVLQIGAPPSQLIDGMAVRFTPLDQLDVPPAQVETGGMAVFGLGGQDLGFFEPTTAVLPMEPPPMPGGATTAPMPSLSPPLTTPPPTQPPATVAEDGVVPTSQLANLGSANLQEGGE